MILGIAFVLFGVYGVGTGIYLFVAPGAEQRIRNGYVFRTGLVPSRGLWGSIPVGLAIICIGVATVAAEGHVYDWFMALGIAFGFLGTIAIIWAPNWIRPKWARRAKKE